MDCTDAAGAGHEHDEGELAAEDRHLAFLDVAARSRRPPRRCRPRCPTRSGPTAVSTTKPVAMRCRLYRARGPCPAIARTARLPPCIPPPPPACPAPRSRRRSEAGGAPCSTMRPARVNAELAGDVDHPGELPLGGAVHLLVARGPRQAAEERRAFARLHAVQRQVVVEARLAAAAVHHRRAQQRVQPAAHGHGLLTIAAGDVVRAGGPAHCRAASSRSPG